MSTITIPEAYGPILGTAIDEPDENGWVRSDTWIYDASVGDDYTVSRVFEAGYTRTLDSGRILTIDIAYYVEYFDSEFPENEDGTPFIDPARCGPMERTNCRSFPDAEAYENGYSDFDSYEYEHVGYLMRDTPEEYELEAFTMASADLRWALCWDGSTR